ncbi:NAD-dependent malic enzyme, mitochondrial [Brettanomyces nanus]|uniref:NAD-dependent malic enzyme, mitochondrial n=1 Tax=Eeniella nana TaxID=13502 RepID=A0A875SA72_EENNA|nr:NAD-dependent malic enzyme, mitochondrial [Brettanomyces nanus]QPG76489.1 NAD-dependent malic enzyme, mitochondrial [Brettanomyces nanus]
MTYRDTEDHIPHATRLTTSGPIECDLSGFQLLNSSLFNKGSAFSLEERAAFDLSGLLPPVVNSLYEQAERAYMQLHFFRTPLAKSDFCTSMRVQNKVLYYKLVRDHIKELLPIVYTPTEGDAIIAYSSRFRKPEGCFLDINDPDGIDDRLRPFGRDKDIDYIVISDSEGILGIGDQGVGGVRICVAKASLMTLCGGLHPGRVLSAVLDVGTNNKKLIEDELYMGNRFPRIRGKAYDEFVEQVMTSLHNRFPHAVIHFEDFGVTTARPVLERYRKRYACFNDDIQGTGAVAMASMSAALKVTNRKLSDAQVLIFGAGSAGLGISDQITNHMVSHGASREQAHQQIHCIDRFGLILDNMEDVSSAAQMSYADKAEDWKGVDTKNLVEVIRKIKPTVMIGCSTQAGAFTEAAVKEMYKHNPRPIIFPLSNPTRLCEVLPEDALKWTDYNALVATGSPFPPVKGHVISENNNCVAFPGIGLGAVLARCKSISDTMISAAVDELAEMSPAVKDHRLGLLPDLETIDETSARIATAVIMQALKEGVVNVEQEDSPSGGKVKVPRDFNRCLAWVKSQMWMPKYRPLIKVEHVNAIHTHQY